MNGSARRALAVAVVLSSTITVAYAQAVLQPTPEPLVTAERTEWYLAGEPITFDGHIYYPVGAPVHFNRYEMVRSGSYRGVPLYARTTYEPYSIVFVPLPGGVMQPYDRRRDGEIAGTVGTTTSALPVVVPTRGDNAGLIPQAAMPGVVFDRSVAPAEEPVVAVPTSRAPAPAAVGMSGPVTAPVPHRPYEPLIKPQGLNGAYVEFDGRRWFTRGRVVSLDEVSLTQIGSHHGFPVYAAPADRNTIYISVTREAGSLATPFSTRR